MIRVLGIDPGLAATGWGIVEAEGNKFKLIDYGYIKTIPGDNPGKRLMIIYNTIREIIDKYNPENAGVEDIFFARNKQSAIPVAQSKGVILLALESKGLNTVVFTPLQIKQALTGNGRADKNQVQEMVKLILGVKDKIKPDHAADALAAAICYHNNSSLGVK
ncbi:MAG: crossover junction endodeoxyribonuclease RuvC [Spirochaetia bacterium]|jgi:crossover junction endodeoxyribonuclease RuvC|nr:crossover junction endodeoxyribonuclease RuvC [Spirochaetia bacterium]